MSETTSKVHTIVRELEQTLLTAMSARNLDLLNGLLHDDLLFHIPNGQTITKSIDMDTYRSGGMKIDDIQSSIQEINIIGDNAIVSTTVEMKGWYFEHPLDGRYKIIRVWKRFEENWQVIAGSSMLLN